MQETTKLVDKKIDYSLVLATYNEPDIVGPDVEKIIKFLDKFTYSYEIILVDDCGARNAREVIKELVRKYGSDHNISYIFNETNQGRGKSLALGFEKARGPIIGYLDIDLEISHCFIPQHVYAIKEEGYDLAMGRRMDIFGIRSLHRSLASRIYRDLIRLFTGIPFIDSDTAYKFFKKEAYNKIASHITDPYWFWDTQLIYWACKSGWKIKQIPVIFIERNDKQSNVKFFKDGFYLLKKLITFKRE